MKLPDKIFIQENDASMRYGINQSGGIKGMHAYIRKDALLEWCMKKVEEYRQMDIDFGGDVFLGNRHGILEVVAKINEL